MLELNELQMDAMTEAFNVGMGSAAAALSEMVNEEVRLSVPDIQFVNKSEAANLLTKQVNTNVSGVTQGFEGPFDGKAMLLFPQEQSLELVRLLLRDMDSVENITELAQEALCEIGNIILNAGLSSLADMFQQEMQCELPFFTHGSCQEVMNSENRLFENHHVLLLHVDFKLERLEIEGYVMFLMDVKSQLSLSRTLDTYLKSIVA